VQVRVALTGGGKGKRGVDIGRKPRASLLSLEVGAALDKKGQ